MSDTHTVRYAPEALDDLRGIYTYIAFTLQAPGTAQKQVNRIRKGVRALGFLPLRHPVVDWEPWQSMGMRKVPIDHFVVYYTVEDTPPTVTVIRIVYGGRDRANLLP